MSPGRIASCEFGEAVIKFDVEKQKLIGRLPVHPAGMPQDVKVEVRNLTNGTQLSWKAPAAGAPKGYFILMRETSSAVWEKKIFVSGTEVSLPYSKDNYFFGVQSVSAGGNESLPVVPLPLPR